MATDSTGTNTEKVGKVVGSIIELRTTVQLLLAAGGVGLPVTTGLMVFSVTQAFKTEASVDRLSDCVERLETQVASLTGKIGRLDSQSATTAGKIERLDAQSAATATRVERLLDRLEKPAKP